MTGHIKNVKNLSSVSIHGLSAPDPTFVAMLAGGGIIATFLKVATMAEVPKVM